VVAFLGVFLSHTLHLAWIDGAASIVIGLLLATVALILGRETKGLLLGESAEGPMNETIRKVVEADEDVAKLSRALTLQLGPGEVLLNMDVCFSPELDQRGIGRAVERLESKLQKACPDIREIFIESRGLHDGKDDAACSSASGPAEPHPTH
jgi:divalent metal cation (Fe/Co/Zn/Cd) transporter